MKIIIVNGNPDESNVSFENYLEEYQKKLYNTGFYVKVFTLRDMNLKFCAGCFKCWHTNPGICNINDDIKYIHREVANADLVVWASPLIKGFFSALMKKVQERMIPLLHPYVELVEGEIHHKKRYAHYPNHGVIVSKEDHTDNEDLLIAQKIQERYALNFRSKLDFFLSTELSVSEATEQTIASQPADMANNSEFENLSELALALYTSSLN
jgi:multimeric flavodoxin WrbA